MKDKHCLNCKHHTFDLETDTIHCNHPQRPDTPVIVIRWLAGCAQHEQEAD